MRLLIGMLAATLVLAGCSSEEPVAVTPGAPGQTAAPGPATMGAPSASTPSPAAAKPAAPAAVNPASALAPQRPLTAAPIYPAPGHAQVQAAFVEALDEALLRVADGPQKLSYRQQQLQRIATARVGQCAPQPPGWRCQVQMQGATATLGFQPSPGRASGWAVIAQ